MDARELRIGNLVKTDFRDLPIEVLSITEKGINVYPDDDGKPYGMHNGVIETTNDIEELRGIPLTEEWLIRFGFSKVEESPFDEIKLKYWVNNRICLFFNESPPYNTYLVGWADQRFGKYSVVTGDWIETVHRLQNVFHALTNSELTLKEKVI